MATDSTSPMCPKVPVAAWAWKASGVRPAPTFRFKGPRREPASTTRSTWTWLTLAAAPQADRQEIHDESWVDAGAEDGHPSPAGRLVDGPGLVGVVPPGVGQLFTRGDHVEPMFGRLHQLGGDLAQEGAGGVDGHRWPLGRLGQGFGQAGGDPERRAALAPGSEGASPRTSATDRPALSGAGSTAPTMAESLRARSRCTIP